MLFRSKEVGIYCFADSGIKYLIEAYNIIVDMHNIDTIVLIDGGTDSLMKGDEVELGTPYEDISSIVAVQNTKVDKKYLFCLGFNIDKFHGVRSIDFLKNTAIQMKSRTFLGGYFLTIGQNPVQKYIEAFKACSPENSIVNSLVVSALEGDFGDHHPQEIANRIEGTIQEIDPLMTMYWIYNLEGLYKQLKYNVDKLKETKDETEIQELLNEIRVDRNN